MALVKEIMGQTMVEAFLRYDALRGSSQSHLLRCVDHKNKVSLLPTFSELKTVVQQPAPLAPPFAKDIIGSKRINGVALNPVTLTTTGTVTIKNSLTAEEKMMATLLPYNTSTLRGTSGTLVMQIVSTEIDSSKH